MKFSLVAALVVVLAIAHGSEAGTLVKRDIQAEVDRITKTLNDMSATITSTTQDLVEKVKALEVQSYVEEGKAQLGPLVENVQAQATKLQEQIQPFITNIKEQVQPYADDLQGQVQPLAANLQEKVQPLTDMMEKFLQQIKDQTLALMPPQ